MKHFIKIGLILISSVLLVGCTKEIAQDDIMDTYSYVEDKSTYVLENDSLVFTLDPNTTYFEVRNKKDNSIWTSNPVDAENDPSADAKSKKYLQSTLLLEYSNDAGINTLFNNFEYSISKNNFQVIQEQDYVKVNYTIGDIRKEYIFPQAIPESRITTFMDKMDAAAKKKINSYYRKLDINNLRPTDNKADLLELYPDLEQENVYVIREGIQEYLKVKIEEIFAAAGYTREDFEADNKRYSDEAEENKPYFNVSIIYRLEDNELVIELPFEDMMWTKTFPLTKVKLLPYFGAGSTADQGFLLVPEGNGGIIQFNNGKVEQSSYYNEVYGWDEGIKRDAVIDERRSSFPVFGISKNGSSMIGILEDYASVASIEADISGRSHSYNYIGATYTALHASSLNVSAKTDKSVMVFEAKKPTGSIKQRYCFLESDTYTDMAVAYREYLMSKHNQLVKRDDSDTPVNITLIGAIDTIKQRLGFPVSVPTSLTSYTEAQEMVKDFISTGYKNLSIRYSGWTNNGIKQKVLDNVKTISQLGSEKDLKKLVNFSKEQGVDLYLEGTVTYAFPQSGFNGFSISKDVAKYSSREVIKLYSFSPVYYGIEDWKDAFYLLKPQRTITYMENLKTKAKEYGTNVAFSDIGYVLSADYNPKNLTTREEVIHMQQEKLSEIQQENVNVMIKYGNDYALPYASLVTDMELKGNQFQIIDTMVPFYSIAIHGLVNYTGASINLSGDFEEQILKSAETGAGLSFTFMKESSNVLQDSLYTYLFGCDYSKWKEEAYRLYSRYNEELGHCFNQFITTHEILSPGVFVTTYEDGTKVYTNYNYDAYNVDDLNIPARDYKVERR